MDTNEDFERPDGRAIDQLRELTFTPDFAPNADGSVLCAFGDTKVIGPLLIGLGQPIEVAPLRASTSEILNLASIAAYSSDVIDYSN